LKKKIGKRKLAWPKDALKRGTLHWGLAVIVFAAQLSTIVGDFGFPSAYDALFCGGLALCGIAGFESYRTFRFIFNSQYQPRLNWSWMSLGLVIGVIDAMSLFFLILLYATFETMPMVGKVFMLLLVPSIPSSILHLWAMWTEKSSLLRNVTYVLALSPYLFLIALVLIGHVLMVI